MRFIQYTLLVILGVPVALAAGNWPQWRGPHANGVAEAGDYPVHFSATEHVRWKVKLPGPGSSTPAIWNDRIFVTGPVEDRDSVLCLNREGQECWRTVFGPESKGKHRAGTSANSSPVTDGKALYAYYKSGTVVALDFDGNVIWKDNLQERYGKSTLWWDLGTSPVLTRDNLVIAVMQAGDSFLVALDRATGKIAWKTSRIFDCERESDQAYTTPIVLSESGREQLICWGADHLSSHDALTGQMTWACDGFNPKRKAMWRVISSPAIGDGVAIVSYGRGKSLAGIDVREGTGDDKRWLWSRDDIGCDVPTPAISKGKAYVLRENGRIACIDIGTGKDLWAAKLPDGHGTFYASPVLAGDLIYCTSFSGVIFVGRATNTFTLLASNTMNEEMTATPIPLDGMLLVRGFTHLFCIEK